MAAAGIQLRVRIMHFMAGEIKCCRLRRYLQGLQLGLSRQEMTSSDLVFPF